ncbi:mandelate racemase/muconate lactonizing enzyme family protein [Virgibacillus sp. W0181]|uniref:mandelate racemase/muconate lactonizing enzyme family protein n=1 Tax=Virgibacillus sp. W0181 TaxID=3391581 RepID=UPI003F454913
MKNVKIIEAEIYGVAYPLKKPFIISYTTYHHMPTVLIKLKTSDGMIGWGEATPDEHVTGESLTSTIAMLRDTLLPAIAGKSPFEMERIHEAMNEAVYGAPTAKAAIDIACYDLAGKALKTPVYQLLGGKYREEMEVPYVLSILPPEQLVKEAKEAVAKGYQILKMKVGTDLALDVERIRKVAEAVGDSISIKVDANQGWSTVANTLKVLRQLKNVSVDWYEQPVMADDFEGLATVRLKSEEAIMADEGIRNSSDLYKLLKLQAVDFINIKLMKCGGIFPAMKLSAQAEMAGVPAQMGSMVESGVASLAGLHVMTAVKNVISHELVGPEMFADDAADFSIQGPTVRIPEKPGLGIVLDEEKLLNFSSSFEKVNLVSE